MAKLDKRFESSGFPLQLKTLAEISQSGSLHHIFQFSCINCQTHVKHTVSYILVQEESHHHNYCLSHVVTFALH